MTMGEQTGCAAAPVVADSAPRLNLVIQKGPQAGTRILCRHVVTLIGSRAHCKVRLDHERVAPVHVAIINTGKQITAVDLLTSAHTLLNGLKMEQEVLSDGDKLEIGPWDFTIEITKPARNGSHNGELMDLEPTPNVIALEHVDTGRVLQPNRDICLLGRRNGCDIVISDPDVSRVHALLMTYRDRPAIVDLLSRNGSLVNDQTVHFQTLKDGDVVTVGESLFRVRIIESGVSEKVAKRVSGKPAAVPAESEEELIELEAVEFEAAEPETDLVNIESVESAQKWRIADDIKKLEKVARR